jgi:hypothetical protein
MTPTMPALGIFFTPGSSALVGAAPKTLIEEYERQPERARERVALLTTSNIVPDVVSYLHQFIIGGCLNDLIELSSITRDQTNTLDDYVICRPCVALPQQSHLNIDCDAIFNDRPDP